MSFRVGCPKTDVSGINGDLEQGHIDLTFSLETASFADGDGNAVERAVKFSLSMLERETFGDGRDVRAGDARCFLGVPGIFEDR